jgi:hypothetical protein
MAHRFRMSGIKIKSIMNNTATAEGPVTKMIEKQTSKVPGKVLLWSALGVATAAVTLHMFRQKRAARMMIKGIAPLLIMGLYNKIVKRS